MKSLIPLILAISLGMTFGTPATSESQGPHDELTRNSRAKTKIYKDILTGDEMFSDIYKIELLDEVIYEVYGSWIPVPGQEGENAVDIVLNSHLVETFVEKDDFKKYLKEYKETIIKKLTQDQPDQVDVFKNNIDKAMGDIFERYEKLRFFTGASEDSDGMIALMEYRKIDGQNVPVLTAFKHGLVEENV